MQPEDTAVSRDDGVPPSKPRLEAKGSSSKRSSVSRSCTPPPKPAVLPMAWPKASGASSKQSQASLCEASPRPSDSAASENVTPSDNGFHGLIGSTQSSPGAPKVCARFLILEPWSKGLVMLS